MEENEYNIKLPSFSLFRKLKNLIYYEPYTIEDHDKLMLKSVVNKKNGEIYTITAVSLMEVMVSGYGWVEYEDLLYEWLFMNKTGYKMIGKYKKK